MSESCEIITQSSVCMRRISSDYHLNYHRVIISDTYINSGFNSLDLLNLIGHKTE